MPSVGFTASLILSTCAIVNSRDLTTHPV